MHTSIHLGAGKPGVKWCFAVRGGSATHHEIGGQAGQQTKSNWKGHAIWSHVLVDVCGLCQLDPRAFLFFVCRFRGAGRKFLEAPPCLRRVRALRARLDKELPEGADVVPPRASEAVGRRLARLPDSRVEIRRSWCPMATPCKSSRPPSRCALLLKLVCGRPFFKDKACKECCVAMAFYQGSL